ncbi:MAG: cyclic nucleotide-binding domain-containing protein [Myxococcaceae bacterium]|nr:cyclic nucleotide-binding domain-containing protein [Myxococcaceae bacterium]
MDPREIKDKATQLFSKGKFAKAAEAYEQYCKADPKDLQARLRMGDAWAKAGQKDRAIGAYQAAAEGFAKDGFLPRAIAASKLVLELDPGHKGVSKMLADLYARKSGATRPSTARTIGAKPDPSPAEKPTAPIEITVEEPVAEAPAPVVAAPPPPPAEGIEIELAAGPVTGEVEIPIEGLDPPPSALPAPGELPPELEVAPPLGVELVPPPAPSLELDPPPGPNFELDPPPAPNLELDPPPAPSFELEVDSVSEAPLAGPVEAAQAPATVPPAPLAADAVPAPEARASPAVVSSPSSASVDRGANVDALDSPPSAPPDVVVLTRKRAPTPSVSSSPPQGAPPGLKPRQPTSEVKPEPPQSSPSGARIWLPPTFQPPAATTAAPTPSGPVAPPAAAELQTELEKSLEAFARFDVDAPPPAPAAPVAKAPVRSVASFTELELEGDSLLQAVEAAASLGAPPVQSSGSVQITAEEAMDAPDDARPEPGALPKIPLFSDLPEDAFIALFERCPLRRAEPGDRVIDQGSIGTSFFVICSGKARVLRTEGDATRELAMLDEGAFFGEMALLSDAPRSASVEAAAEDTQLLEIPALVLTELSTKYPTVATALKKFCRQRLLANLMNSAALFKPFTPSERRGLIQKFRARDALPGETLIREGQPSDGLYVVLTGEVAVDVGGRPVATLKEGQVFGEMSLLTRSVTMATVKTTRRTSLLRLPRADFDQLIMSHPQILEQVAELTDERRRQNAALQVRPNATASMV